MTDKYVCIHGHFYQPPRENPWLEDVEYQDSAHPWHDWNARITDECYRRNAASRILRPDRRIVDIVNNYENISFNFGPSLLYWLEFHAPEVYGKVLEADHASRQRFSGHGCALAQVYNHMIMPLANERDKQTQVIWAIRDFQRRFGRNPEGMWLPETAVDTPTLEVLATHGIRFTILTPRQADRVRPFGKRWKKISADALDTSIPYLCKLPSQKEIVLFFCNGPISHDVAYGGLLHNGENLARRLAEAFGANEMPARLVHIAVDGESFGHHHPQGDMALAYCLHHLETNHLARITIYAEFMDRFPPQHEVQILENSSWSCAHGVERWRSNCGCAMDLAKSSLQDWRQPLREALDWLRDELAPAYEAGMRPFTSDPWQVRDDYIDVIGNRDPENIERFVQKWAGHRLSTADTTTFLKLLELQRNAMLMYTSCGWFFDEVSGIETVQVLRYAARAVQLCLEATGRNLEPEFEQRLERIPCGVRGLPDGRQLYRARVEPSRIDLNRVAAQFALSAVFDECAETTTDVYAYSAAVADCRRIEAGLQVLTTSRVAIRSRITLQQHEVELAAMYLGDTNVFAAVWGKVPEQEYRAMRDQLENAFRHGDTNEVMQRMARAPGGQYSLSHLFRDQQRRILDRLLAFTWQEIEGDYRHIYEHNYAIMQRMRTMDMPLPRALAAPAEFVIDNQFIANLQADPIDFEEMHRLAQVAGDFAIYLDLDKLRFEGAKRINSLMRRLRRSPRDTALLEQIVQLLDLFRQFAPGLNLQDAQNIFFDLAQREYAYIKTQTQDEQTRRWLERFERLAGDLDLAIP